MKTINFVHIQMYLGQQHPELLFILDFSYFYLVEKKHVHKFVFPDAILDSDCGYIAHMKENQNLKY